MMILTVRQVLLDYVHDFQEQMLVTVFIAILEVTNKDKLPEKEFLRYCVCLQGIKSIPGNLSSTDVLVFFLSALNDTRR